MAKVKDTKIPDMATPWENYSGKRVEEFIKEALTSMDSIKFGYMAVESGVNNLQTLRFFKDEKSYQEWFSDKQKYESNVLREFSFYSNKPEATFTTKVTVNRYLSESMPKGGSNVFSIAYNCYWGDDPTDKDTASGEMGVIINGKEISALGRKLIASGSPVPNVYSVDLGEHLTEETNEVTIYVKNTHGFAKMYKFTVKVYGLTVSFEDTYDESAVQFGAWNLRVNCSGTSATVYCKVTNNGTSEIYTKTIENSSGEFTIDQRNTFAYGSHDIIVWAENLELGLKTPEIKTTYIKGSLDEKAVPALCFGKGIPEQAKQFTVIDIPYYFYLPQETSGQVITVDITLMYDGEGKTKRLSAQEITLGANKQSGIQKVRVPLDDGNYLPEMSVNITVGSLSIKRKIRVESIGVTIKDAPECKVFYTMRGKANGDKDTQNLVSTYEGKITSRLIRSANFKLDENNGFIDGYGMTIRPGKTLTLADSLPFGDDFGANGNKKGRTIELEFQSGICSNENTVIIDCWNAGTGFRVYANRVELGCSTGSIFTYFPEQTRVKVSFVIDGATTHTKNDLGGGSIQEADANLAYLYVNGVIVRVMDYSAASWKQGSPKNIVIGSSEALVELYSIRIYDKALTFAQVLGNFAFDNPDIEDVYENGVFSRFGKVSTAKRNDILNSTGDIHQPGEIISYNKVKTALPDTPKIIWDIDNLPYNKNNPDVPINGTEFENPVWDPTKYGDAMAPFKVGQHMFNADGTSSNGYPSPYKNWAEKFKTAAGEDVQITLDPKNTKKNVTAYSITVGVTKGETDMVHKVNFASSEGIFNIHAMNVFHEILLECAKTDPSLYTKFQKEQADRQEPVTFRKSLSGFPEIGFRRTSLTGNASPLFLSIYNFINNKYSASFLGFPKNDFKKAQIWEIDENVNFFNREVTDNEIVGGKVKQSSATKKSGPMYYARVPKKSPTNKANKFGQLKEPTDNVAASNEELAALKRFHNWVVSCNYHLCERHKIRHGDYQQLPQPVTYNGTVYKFDNPEYRKAKFVNEAHEYVEKNDALFYFVFCLFIIGMDSMDKNMSIGFDDIKMSGSQLISSIARLLLRDTDSRDLFNNSGVLTFKYWHEWNDAFNVATQETSQINGERYNGDTDSWEPNMKEGASPVFNGRLSGLMDLIWECWGDDLANMYKTMRDNGLNSKYLFKRYVDFWKQWCENLYNADAMGYVNTGHFTKAYGDKLLLSMYFYEKRSRYLDAKFCCGASIVNNLRMRLYEQGKGLAIKHYSPMYASVQWGANNFYTVRNIDGGYAHIPFGFNNPQNATFDIDDADMITEIKTYTKNINGKVTYYGLEGLGNFYFDSNMSLCTRLTEFIMDYSETSPNTLEQGTAFDLSKMSLLKKVIVRNVKNLTKVITLSTEIASEIDFTGSGIKGLVTPSNQYLTRMALPATIEELNLTGFTSLQEGGLVLQGIDNIVKLRYHDCPNIGFVNILGKVYNNGKLRFIDAKDIDITIADREIWKIISESSGEITGRITIKGFTLNFLEKAMAIRKWGDVDDDNNKLRIVHDVVPCTRVEVSGDAYIQEISSQKRVYEVFPFPNTANDISLMSWSISENPYATIEEATGELRVTKISNVLDDQKAKAVIRVTVTKSDKSVLQNQLEVRFCKRTTMVGDFVLNDGTTTDVHSNKSKNIIGICYYINDNDRRMFTPSMRSAAMGADEQRLNALNVTANWTGIVDGLTAENTTEYGGYKRGVTMPSGKINTLVMLENRDNVLYRYSPTLYKKIVTDGDFVATTRLYGEDAIHAYQASAIAFLYIPSGVDKEDKKFGQGCWYLPSIKEAEGIMTLKNNKKVTDAIGVAGGDLFKNTFSQHIQTSSVISNNLIWLAQYSNQSIQISIVRIFNFIMCCQF